ncbi:VOC family protein [Candidatus Enterococcus ferrettii]|uniref:VOC domain-containing protein n=1 Tax=Candidatus Enterococcus ferrettii TaxID=2815324 RepID=A0ABV0EPV0_9ENTE|nr:VOC family protein [Enterococcus sp. 665A]MBO1341147.1 VOC family protein [Enterococcus sp. 665A]
MKYRFHHLHITVEDVSVSEKFYDQLFTILGWDITSKYKGDLPHMDMSVVEYMHEDLDFAICSPKKELRDITIDARTPKAIQHLAFAAESKQAVNDFYKALSQLDVNILHDEARYYDKIAPNYYAVFFEDPNGVRLEVFHHKGA